VTIRKGEAWGIAVDRPADAERIDSDAELARRVASGHRGPFALTGGEIVRTLGGVTSGATIQQVPIDALRIELDDRPLVAVAHVVARRPGPLGWWRGPIVAVMNVGAIGRADVAPRAHPNDGRADVVDVEAAMSVRARLQARRRLGTGTHVPHPSIRTSQSHEATFDFDRPMRVRVDGVEIGRARRLRVTVEPDACVVFA